MAVDVLPSNVGETSTSPGGTGDLDLEGAIDASYQTFAASAQIADGETTVAAIFNQDTPGEWEISEVKYVAGAPDVIQRQTVLLSSNGGNLTNFTNGDSLHVEVEVEGRQLGLVFAKHFTDAAQSLQRGVSTATIFGVQIDASKVTKGSIKLDTDGSEELSVAAGSRQQAVVRVTSSVAVRSPSTATFGGLLQSLDVSTQETGPSGVFVKTDGKKIYVVGSSTNDAIYEYDLSTAWDLSTASFNQSLTNLNNPRAVAFKRDGARLYVPDPNDNAINQWDLPTAWDISTATNRVQLAENAVIDGIAFKDDDGAKLYLANPGGSVIEEFDLSTAWDVSTGSQVNVLDVSAQDTSPQGVTFNSDGSKMYVSGSQNDNVYEYDLLTPWDTSTATFNRSFDVSGQDTAPRDIDLRDDDTRLFMAGAQNANVYKYEISALFSGTANAVLTQEV